MSNDERENQGKSADDSATPGGAGNPTPKKKTGGKHPPTPGVGSVRAKRRERIRLLEAQLQQERSRDASESRKERDGQLYVLGAMVERAYKHGTDDQRKTVTEWIGLFLTEDVHRIRARDGLERMDDERSRKKG